MIETSALRCFDESVAILTGAGSGIGEALARELGRRGAVVVCTDRRAGEAERVAHAIRGAGGCAESHGLDVRDAAAVERLVGSVHASRGRIDYLFNNAGIGVAGEVLELGLDDFQAIVDVNVMGVVNGVLAAYPRMTAQGFGHIVSTASMSGLMPSPMTAAYALSKHAVVGLSRSLRVEAEHYGVKVSVLCPGVIATPILEGGAFGRMARRPTPESLASMFSRTRPMEPGAFAKETLDRVAKNEATIIVPARWRLVDLVVRLSPALTELLFRLAFRTMKAEFDRGERAPPRGAEPPPL